jgi:hypothetical protein
LKGVKAGAQGPGLARQRSGYGSFTLSPPLIVSHCPFPQDGHGGRLFDDPTSIWLPQFVQR